MWFNPTFLPPPGALVFILEPFRYGNLQKYGIITTTKVRKMTPISNYKKFFTELIRRHMAILGPNISRDVALQATGLAIDATGEATDITGDPLLVMQDLVAGFMDLSAPVTQLILYALLEEMPAIKADYNQPLSKINLICTLTRNQPDPQPQP